MSDGGDNFTNSLQSYVERIERLNEEIKGLQDDRKEVFAEASQAGYLAKVVRRIVKERAIDPEELDEFDRLTAQYWGALGR